MARDPYDPAWNPTGCGPEEEDHQRTGLVTNQDPDQPYSDSRPHRSRAVCHREVCQQQALGWVAKGTGEPGRYYDDAERRAKKKSA